MAKKSGAGSTKRFGARYGRTIRNKLGKIEADKRSGTKCPYCHAEGVRRKASGIWHCTKCNATFTGKAYVPETTKLKLEEGAE